MSSDAPLLWLNSQPCLLIFEYITIKICVLQASFCPIAPVQEILPTKSAENHNNKINYEYRLYFQKNTNIWITYLLVVVASTVVWVVAVAVVVVVFAGAVTVVFTEAAATVVTAVVALEVVMVVTKAAVEVVSAVVMVGLEVVTVVTVVVVAKIRPVSGNYSYLFLFRPFLQECSDVSTTKIVFASLTNIILLCVIFAF